ncbi:hypothetical protein R6Z07F_009285 [Ovis aries]
MIPKQNHKDALKYLCPPLNSGQLPPATPGCGAARGARGPPAAGLRTILEAPRGGTRLSGPRARTPPRAEDTPGLPRLSWISPRGGRPPGEPRPPSRGAGVRAQRLLLPRARQARRGPAAAVPGGEPAEPLAPEGRQDGGRQRGARTQGPGCGRGGRVCAGDAAAQPRALTTMPFPPAPPPPPTPAPGVPAARPPPRRPGAPRKPAAPACAPPGPSPPAAAAEKKRRPPERPPGPLSSSWPSATLKRPPARRAPGPASPRAPAPCASRPAGSGDSPAGTAASGARTAASGAGPDAALRFSLSLTPEAVLVIQRRHLERQLLARPRRAPPADAGRPPAACPRAAGLGRLAPPPPPAPGPRPADLRSLLKVSLLNERHKYDDVEYEEEAATADEGLVRKCTEWLRGVESAAAARDRAGPLDALPHLSSL